ncbi:MAG: hypothetical protein AB8H80_20050 [Planctomycetota bacterium]
MIAALVRSHVAPMAQRSGPEGRAYEVLAERLACLEGMAAAAAAAEFR